MIKMDSTSSGNHSHECPILANRPLINMARIIARVIKKIEQNDSNQVEVIGSYLREWDCLMDRMPYMLIYSLVIWSNKVILH